MTAYRENLKELTGKTYYECVEAMVDKMEARFGDLSDPSCSTEVLGIARGGLIPATYAVYRLGCPLNILYLRSYAKPEVQKQVEAYGILPFRGQLLPKRLLVVDDILDTGNSFAFIRKFFEENFPSADGTLATELVFCAVIQRERPNLAGPDIHGAKTASMEWVKFPYEKPFGGEDILT